MASDINCSTKTRNIRLVKRNITSAVFAEMSIELKGNTSFFNNIGGGITIVERRIDVHDNVEFINNCSPYDGGGISLEDESFVSGIYLVTFYASLFQAKFAIYICMYVNSYIYNMQHGILIKEYMYRCIKIHVN